MHPSRSRTSASQSGTPSPYPVLAAWLLMRECWCVCMCAGPFQSMATNLVGDVNGHIAIIVVRAERTPARLPCGPTTLTPDPTHT